MNGKNGKRILRGDYVEIPGYKGPMEVYGGNVSGTELWFFDYVSGTFKGIDPRTTSKID